ncbi:unnamed protein product [Clonostachys chloroleuca]|uniref:Integral membrane protein n=1 Tax=Clonostachys chloroleuca TaxID=1926264 RepID=A0AA35MJL3_9HYPO|nr:unnamed protein product [Clonostachys chloroleuca]
MVLVGAQLQKLHIQDHKSPPQSRGQVPTQHRQGSTHPGPTQIPTYDPDTDFEPPPGPPPNWAPPAKQPPSSSEPPVLLSPQAEQPSQNPNLKPTDPVAQDLWKFPKPHPCGVTPLAECAAGGINLDVHWFHHPTVPSLYICSRCYAEHVYDPRFHESFEKVHMKAAESPCCSFPSRRLKEQLWPAALASGDLAPVLEYMKMRAALPPCPAAASVEGGAWYVSTDIQGSTMCPACFEDAGIEPVIREKFTLQTISNGCTCDLACTFIDRLLKETKKIEEWKNFVEGVSARISMPACPKGGKRKAQGLPWYQTNEGRPSMQICVACYLDYFVGTPDAQVFHQVGGGDYDTHCDIGNSYLEIAANTAVWKDDQEIFWKAAKVVKSQPCTTEGIQGKWYTLPNNPPGFGICEACFVAVVESMGAEHFFVGKGDYPWFESKILCGFNSEHGRFGNYMARFVQSALTGDPKYIGDYAGTYGNVLTCPRDHYRRGKNRKFWGWGVSAICEECYISFAKGTALEGRFALKGDPDPKGRMCDMYSPRMRKLYMEACETGDLEGFLAIGNQRHEVWCATIAVCDRIQSDMQMAAFQANRLRSSSMFYNFLGHSVDNTIGHSYTVGNSYAGYGHANDYLLTGATMAKQAQEASNEATNLSGPARMAMLRRQWAEVE